MYESYNLNLEQKINVITFNLQKFDTELVLSRDACIVVKILKTEIIIKSRILATSRERKAIVV